MKKLTLASIFVCLILAIVWSCQNTKDSISPTKQIKAGAWSPPSNANYFDSVTISGNVNDQAM